MRWVRPGSSVQGDHHPRPPNRRRPSHDRLGRATSRFPSPTGSKVCAPASTATRRRARLRFPIAPRYAGAPPRRMPRPPGRFASRPGADVSEAHRQIVAPSHGRLRLIVRPSRAAQGPTSGRPECSASDVIAMHRPEGGKVAGKAEAASSPSGLVHASPASPPIRRALPAPPDSRPLVPGEGFRARPERPCDGPRPSRRAVPGRSPVCAPSSCRAGSHGRAVAPCVPRQPDRRPCGRRRDRTPTSPADVATRKTGTSESASMPAIRP